MHSICITIVKYISFIQLKKLFHFSEIRFPIYSVQCCLLIMIFSEKNVFSLASGDYAITMLPSGDYTCNHQANPAVLSYPLKHPFGICRIKYHMYYYTSVFLLNVPLIKSNELNVPSTQT